MPRRPDPRKLWLIALWDRRIVWTRGVAAFEDGQEQSEPFLDAELNTNRSVGTGSQSLSAESVQFMGRGDHKIKARSEVIPPRFRYRLGGRRRSCQIWTLTCANPQSHAPAPTMRTAQSHRGAPITTPTAYARNIIERTLRYKRRVQASLSTPAAWGGGTGRILAISSNLSLTIGHTTHATGFLKGPASRRVGMSFPSRC